MLLTEPLLSCPGCVFRVVVMLEDPARPRPRLSRDERGASTVKIFFVGTSEKVKPYNRSKSSTLFESGPCVLAVVIGRVLSVLVEGKIWRLVKVTK